MLTNVSLDFIPYSCPPRNLLSLVQYKIRRQLKLFVLFVVKHHYTGNKSRNALVRQDFPHALDEQRREEEEAAALRAVYHQMVHQQ